MFNLSNFVVHSLLFSVTEHFTYTGSKHTVMIIGQRIILY